VAERYECPSSHKHELMTTCSRNHGCKCDPCRLAANARSSQLQRNRRRLKAYGKYNGLIPALGTQRRIQGLQWLGWTMAEIGAEAGGVTATAVGLILTRDQVEPGTAENIRRAFGVLIQRGQGTSNITKIRARKKGYVSPFAFDDIDTDTKPTDVKDPDRGQYDPIAVELAASGTPVTGLNWAERREVVRRLHAQRWPDTRIGKLLNMDGDSVCRIRRRLGLEAWAYHERATEYGSEHRERGAA